MKFRDITDVRFGRLTARWPSGRRILSTIWLCSCDCGALVNVALSRLANGETASCGCLRKILATKHGHASTPEYHTWADMLQRCLNPKVLGYSRYGGRGITVCDRWLSFKNFLADMGPRPYKLTIERKNNDGNYEPGNCRWATRKEQQNNMRTNVRLTYQGKTQNLSQWAIELGINRVTLNMRLLKGWSVEKALGKMK